MNIKLSFLASVFCPFLMIVNVSNLRTLVDCMLTGSVMMYCILENSVVLNIVTLNRGWGLHF